MDAELKNKWVSALRSGDYEQGMDSLRTVKGEFCCLGVLCDILWPDQWARDGHGDRPEETWWNEGNGRSFYYLTDSTMAELGLDEETVDDTQVRAAAEGDYLSLAGYFAHLNDLGASFDEIADAIEKKVPVD